MPVKRAKSGKKMLKASGRMAKGRRPSGATRPRRAPGMRVNRPIRNAGPGSGVMGTFAPSAYGSTVPQSTFRYAGPAQQLAAQDSRGSLRICGSDLYSIPVQNTVANSGAFGLSLVGPYYAPLTPSTISTRIQAIEEMFQWYAIRKLRVSYIPTCASTLSASVAFGVATDPRIATLIATPTQQQVLEFQPASMSTVWQPQTFQFEHQGTKLWECYLSAGEALDSRVQAYLAGAFSTPFAALTSAGLLFLEYEIDFYQPTPLLSTVDYKLADLYCRRCQRGETKKPSHPAILCHPSSRMLPQSTYHAQPTFDTSHLEGKVVRDADDDFESPSPPKFSPAPSSVQGSPGWFGSASPAVSASKKVSNK